MELSKIEMRDAAFEKLFLAAKHNPNIVVISNDFGAPSLDRFRSELPNQFINAGIAEQNIIAVAAGMALGGKRVYVYSIASFITLRCLEQIKIDLCVMNLPVTILGVGPGYGYGQDGPTHHATEDLASMRSLANLNIYSPADANTVEALITKTLHSTNPAYIRLDRGKWPLVHNLQEDFSQGFAQLCEGQDVCLVSTGIMTHRAIEVAQELQKHSIESAVIDIYRLKPLQAEALLKSITRSKRVVTIEEHALNGGLGSLIVELLADQASPMPIKRCAISDALLYDYGTRALLHQKNGLDREGLVKTVVSWMQK